MNIHAKCTYDSNAVRDLTHISIFKKMNPKINLLIYAIVFATVLAAHLIVFYAFDFHELAYLTVFTFVFLLLKLDQYLLLPRRMYRGMKNMKDAENSYTFMAENFTVTSGTESYSGQSSMVYSGLVKVYETNRYLFLFQTNRQAYIVDKESMDEKSAEALRGRLMPYFGKKYYICNF